MSDRKLLELAAKAACYQVEWVRNSGCHYRCEEEIGREQWCPLDDDGDALRLAVKVGVCVVIAEGFVIVQRFHADNQGLMPHREKLELHSMAPVRRAIIRAAAEIGRAMP